jgi:pyruvate-ferredoxin/flavodoxin oxidoreductase
MRGDVRCCPWRLRFGLPAGARSPLPAERAPVPSREVRPRVPRRPGLPPARLALAAVGVMAAATGDTVQVRGAPETPVFIAENCTQCMECIRSARTRRCPTRRRTCARCSRRRRGYVRGDPEAARRCWRAAGAWSGRVRAAAWWPASRPSRHAGPRPGPRRGGAARGRLGGGEGQLLGIVATLPLAYSKVNAIFQNLEKKSPGGGGVFSIFVSDLCKGCGECVVVCGEHQALRWSTRPRT